MALSLMSSAAAVCRFTVGKNSKTLKIDVELVVWGREGLCVFSPSPLKQPIILVCTSWTETADVCRKIVENA